MSEPAEHEIVAFPSGGGESYYVKYAAIPRPELPLGTPILIRGYLVDTIEGRPVVGLVGHGMWDTACGTRHVLRHAR